MNLTELNNLLPPAGAPVGNYLNFVKVGNIIYTSGALPMENGTLITGKMGEKSIEEGQHASKVCVLNLLANLKAELGDLSKVKKVVKLVGFVNSLPDFVDQPAVINGASNFLTEYLGTEVGSHARSAVGVASLPKGALVEVELIVELY